MRKSKLFRATLFPKPRLKHKRWADLPEEKSSGSQGTRTNSFSTPSFPEPLMKLLRTLIRQRRSSLSSVKCCQKIIKLANKSEAGWLAVKEYQAEELASDSEDKKNGKAQERALKKKNQNAAKKLDTKKLVLWHVLFTCC